MAAEEEKFVPKYIRRRISADEITLTFTGSGNTYRFTPGEVAKHQAKAFVDVQDAGRSGVTAALKAALERLHKDEDGAPAYTPALNIVVTCGADGDPEDMSARYAETVFGEMSDKWKDAPVGESDDYSKPAERLFAESIEDTVYGQDMRKLGQSGENGAVLVEDCAGAGPQYFYADGTYANGRQVWRKAFNPLLWYGVKQ